MAPVVAPADVARAVVSMRALFEPGSVAIIGASRARGRIGSEILHNLVASGFTGRLYAVHPTAASLQGIPAFPRVTDIGGDVDLAIVAVPAPDVMGVVDDCIAKGVKGLVVISAGFAETGDAGRVLEAELLARVRRAGVRLVGPNCMGLLNTDPGVRLNATFSPVFPPAGRVAMLSQSGALGLAILEQASRLQIGLSTFVSVGNKADVSGNDLLQYWEQDPRTDVVLLYLESFGNPRKFSQIARRLGRRKPIVAVKAGRSGVGARAASSHTGALASSDDVVGALFRQCGVIRTDTMEALFDVTRLLSQQPVPAGRRVAILTNAGGPGILAADACEAQGLEVAALSPATSRALRAVLPAAASTANPVDMIASATAEHYERALSTLLADDGIDSAIVIFIPPMVTSGEDVARAVRQAAAAHPRKTVLTVFMGSAPAAELLRPIPLFVYPEPAAAALAHVTRYGAWRAAPEGAVPSLDRLDLAQVERVVHGVLARGGGWARPAEVARLLDAAGIAQPGSRECATEDEAVAAAGALEYPVVIKAFGPAIVHKTEIGAVRLGLTSAAEVRAVYQDFRRQFGATMSGVLVQQQAAAGVDMLVGAIEDPAFGPLVVCALGGTTAELFADTAFRLAPLTDLDARAMVDALRCAPLLRGFRGAPVADEAALRDALVRLSPIVTAFPEIREFEMNPLRVTARGALALDARVRIETPPPRAGARHIPLELSTSR
jgi:acetyl coenzyme A synthetase (ADP forming)-like protein